MVPRRTGPKPRDRVIPARTTGDGEAVSLNYRDAELDRLLAGLADYSRALNREERITKAAAAELARLRAELEAMTRRAELAEGYAQPYHDEAARLRAELERARVATAEAIIRDCIPGGSVCDPQQVADAIRAWAQEPPA